VGAPKGEPRACVATELARTREPQGLSNLRVTRAQLTRCTVRARLKRALSEQRRSTNSSASRIRYLPETRASASTRAFLALNEDLKIG